MLGEAAALEYIFKLNAKMRRKVRYHEKVDPPNNEFFFNFEILFKPNSYSCNFLATLRLRLLLLIQTSIDGNKDEWAVAFHGVNLPTLGNKIRSIMNGREEGNMLRAGIHQAHKNDNCLRTNQACG
jgi:hypothetical protein